MRLQNLDRVCSLAHLHSFGNIADPEAFVQAAKKLMADDPERRCFLLVVGPRQEAIRKGCNLLRREDRAKRMAVLDTGHGGETTIWLLINNFRGRNPIR